MTDQDRSSGKVHAAEKYSDVKPQVTLFIRASKDGTSPGACPLSHQILMITGLKVDYGAIPESRLKITLVDATRPFPTALRSEGISRIPAIIIGREAEDEPETIMSLLEKKYPGGLDQPIIDKENTVEGNSASNTSADSPELASRDFFSRFSFCVRGVTDGPDHLDAALLRLNSYLIKKLRSSDEMDSSQWIYGTKLPTLLDCEVLPKLHQVRVAGAVGLAGQWLAAEWGIPGAWPGIWNYLHAAYSLPAFTRYCPSDKEIILHWNERAGGYALSQSLKAKMESDECHKVSLFVPAHADPIVID